MTAQREQELRERGAHFVECGPVMIGCMDLDYRNALDEAMRQWQTHLATRERQGIPAPQVGHEAYAFAYWLFRWSGLVIPAASAGPNAAPRSE